MKSKLVFIFSVLLILTGCGKRYSITPDILPTAHVNQNYQQIVKISGGKVVDDGVLLNGNFPKELGISIQPVNDRDGYNLIEIKGIPKYKGTFIIHIQAGFYAGGGNKIDKIYKLEVK